MLFPEYPVIIRGGGDLGTGVAYRLRRAGFPVIVLELERPLTIRREVALSSAVTDGVKRVEELMAFRLDDVAEAVHMARSGRVPVLVSPTLPQLAEPAQVVVDARLAKRNVDTAITDAPLVVGLGPGFSAGMDCHAVVETMRGHRLGRVIWQGGALANTGVPGALGGARATRVLHAASSGRLVWQVGIGDLVAAGDELGAIDGTPVTTEIGGVVRGLLADGDVTVGLKIADIDPRADAAACFEISDKALSVGGGVLEAVLGWMNGQP